MNLIPMIIVVSGAIFHYHGKNRESYALVIGGWAVMVAINIFVDQNWGYAITSAILCVLMIAFFMREQKVRLERPKD